jgi:hypothetical protein
MSDDFPRDSYKDAARDFRRPFTQAAVKFKVQATWPKETPHSGLCVAYIDARLAVERLNLLVPHLWSDAYRPVGQGQMWCDLTIDGITRSDVGEGVGKGLVSDALKRAAVHFGIGVSLYAIPKMILELQTGALKPKRTSKGPSLDLTPRGEAQLRSMYGLWLESHGKQAFGEPLDHGDVEGAAGDHEDGEEPVTPDGVDSNGEVLASAEQTAAIKATIKQHNLTEAHMNAMLHSVSFTRADGETVNAALARLTSAQAQRMLDEMAVPA